MKLCEQKIAVIVVVVIGTELYTRPLSVGGVKTWLPEVKMECSRLDI